MKIANLSVYPGVLSVIVLCCVPRIAAHGWEDEPPKDRQKIRIEWSPGNYENKEWLGHLFSRVMNVEPRKGGPGDGGLVAFGVGAYSRTKEPKECSFPVLRKGSIVPILGRFYRVDRLEQSQRRFVGGAVELLWVPNKDLPAGLKFDPDSVFIPISDFRSVNGTLIPGGTAVIKDCRWSIPKLTSDARESLKAHVWFDGESQVKDQEKRFAILGAGDLVVVQERGYRIRRVVPRDEKTGVIGWLELAPGTIAGQVLTRDKTAIYPEKKDWPTDYP